MKYNGWLIANTTKVLNWMLLTMYMLEGQGQSRSEPRKAFPVLNNITCNKSTAKITL